MGSVNFHCTRLLLVTFADPFHPGMLPPPVLSRYEMILSEETKKKKTERRWSFRGHTRRHASSDMK